MIDDVLIAGFIAVFPEFGGIAVPALTDPSALEAIYSKLPAKFPPLYERIVLSYRWDEIDLGILRLLANPMGNGFNGLAEEIFKDRGIAESLIPDGFIQFGKGPGMNYDPVCFDIRNRRKNGDYRIVQIDHEEILCNFRIRVVAELAPSFRDLVREIVWNHIH